MSEFVRRVPMRWVDLDAQGHVNNAVIADYLQEARVGWLQASPLEYLLGTAMMVVSHQVEYLGPVVFSVEPVEVSLRVGRVDGSRFTLGYSVGQDGRELARARSVLCLYDYAEGRPRRMTPAERSWFRDQAGEVEPFRPLGTWTVGRRAHVNKFVVRWSDLDPNGHVNNVRMFDIIAEARIRMRASGPQDLLWMVARQDVDYLGQVGLRAEPYQVRSAVGRIGRTSVTIVAQVEDPLDGIAFARSRTVLVSGDSSGRPVGLPADMISAGERWPAEPVG